MNIYVTSYLPVALTLVAQYQNDEILLLDGVYQRVQTEMSFQTPRHYYFVVGWDTTITVFLKSFTDTKYVINAKIVSWKEYLSLSENEVYPSYEDNIHVNSSTTPMKMTSLIINKATLSKYKCGYNCVLLISVFTAIPTERRRVHFDIEASQLMNYLYPGDSKLGFIEEGSIDTYEIKTDPFDNQTFLTLKIQPFT